MTDRKPLEELFDFPTSNAPARPARGTAEERDAAAQQDLLFDDEPGPATEAPPGPTELYDEVGQETPWPPAESPGLDAVEADDEGVVTLVDRWLGGAADALLLLAVLCVAVLCMLPLGLVPSRGQWPGFALFLASFSFMYCTFPLAFWGQTPGMAWRGLRAINEDGLSLSFSQTTRRWVGGAITALLLGLPLLVALSGRSIADRLSGSWTVRT